MTSSSFWTVYSKINPLNPMCLGTDRHTDPNTPLGYQFGVKTKQWLGLCLITQGIRIENRRLLLHLKYSVLRIYNTYFCTYCGIFMSYRFANFKIQFSSRSRICYRYYTFHKKSNKNNTHTLSHNFKGTGIAMTCHVLSITSKTAKL